MLSKFVLATTATIARGDFSVMAAVRIKPKPWPTAGCRGHPPKQGVAETDHSAMHPDHGKRTVDAAIAQSDWTKTNRMTISIAGI